MPYPSFAPASVLRLMQLCMVVSLGLMLSAHASDAHSEADHADGTEGSNKHSLKPDLKSKVEGPSGDKVEPRRQARSEGKAEAKSEGKDGGKSEAKSGGKGGDDRASVSMGELRDLIEQKIAEVRTQRAAAPVLRVPVRTSRTKRASGLMNAMYTPDPTAGADPHNAHGAAHASPASPARQGAALDAHVAIAEPVLPSAPVVHDVHWTYGGDTGPQNWGQLKPEFQQCAVGQRQSPIDIRDGIEVQLDPIQFDYHSSNFRVIDNGHTVQVNVDPGNSITVMGHRYDLLQFHFHRPSEERINGRQYEMVAHLVHKDAEGKLAVVAVLMDQGSAHSVVQQIWNNLPLEKNIEQPGLAKMDLKDLLPDRKRYYTYMGSLTTPPCSEGVLWMVMKQPATISREQIAIFAKLYPMNARPIQQASGRLIKEDQ